MRPYALVLSNDLTEPEAMLRLTAQTAPYLDGVKIGITSSMVPGVDVFKKAKEIMRDKAVAAQARVPEEDAVAVLADYKVADIGFTNKKGEWDGTNNKIVKTLCGAGTDYITCHTITGISSIEESVATAHEYGGKVLTLPYMTHKGANLFFGMPIGDNAIEHVVKELQAYGLKEENAQKLYASLGGIFNVTDLILNLGQHFGVDGYIGPANDPDVLQRYRRFTPNEIWSPGFGRQDKKGRSLEQQIEEWAKVVGPNSAMIVGSAIYGAEDPGQAAKEIMELRNKVVARL